jgi:hypothetical protein
MSIKGKIVGAAGLVGVTAVATRIGEVAGVRRLQCACEDDCWCKKPVLSLVRWLVPGRLHHLRPPAKEQARTEE